jgi:hypothetical protein
MVLEVKTETGAQLDNLEDLYPLSPLQQGMLFHTLESPESGVYFEQSVFTIQGPLDVVAFDRAWQTVINRHSILRSSFFWQNLDNPVQAVFRRVDIAVESKDWRSRPTAVQDQLLEEYLAFDRSRPFDLDRVCIQPPPLDTRPMVAFDSQQRSVCLLRSLQTKRSPGPRKASTLRRLHLMDCRPGPALS